MRKKDTVQMYSNKPYLVRAFYDWIVDCDCTPYLMVDAEIEGVEVPEEHIQNGQIVLNLKPEAVRDLELGKRHISFRATFGGNEMHIYVPMHAIRAVYAMENGEGMMFNEEESEDDYPPEPRLQADGKPHLRLLDE